MGGWISVEHLVMKVWTLFLLQQGVKHEQQALEASMGIIKCWRLVEQALEATMDAINVIKPWRFFWSCWGGWKLSRTQGRQWRCHGHSPPKHPTMAEHGRHPAGEGMPCQARGGSGWNRLRRCPWDSLPCAHQNPEALQLQKLGEKLAAPLLESSWHCACPCHA